MARNTRDTTRSDAVAAGLLAAILGSALVVYAALFAEQAWQFAKSEPRYAEIAKGRASTVVELDALTQALRASPARADLSRAAFIQMLTAQRVGLTSPRAVTRLTAARRDQRLGLRASPSNAYAWTRLAVVEQSLRHPVSAAKALGMALRTGPAEHGLTAMQFDLAVILWYELSPEARAALEKRLAWARAWPDLKPVLAGNSANVLRERIAAVHDQGADDRRRN